VTTDSKHKLPVAENLLKQQFKVYKPNVVRVSDINYVPINEGWLYLDGHKDLFTSEIVGYAMGEADSESGQLASAAGSNHQETRERATTPLRPRQSILQP
jgi:transposase InsO family protein